MHNDSVSLYEIIHSQIESFLRVLQDVVLRLENVALD
jgi:hypothetical protein